MNAALAISSPCPISLRQQRCRARLQKALRVSIPKISPQVSVVGNHGREESALSCTQSRNPLQLKDRLRIAVQRRLHPHSALRPKQLAYDTRLSERTIWNVLAGNNDPSARTLAQLGEFFGAAFRSEVYDIDNLADLRSRRVAEIMRQREALDAQLAAALGAGGEE